MKPCGHTPHIGGTLLGQHERTIDLIEQLIVSDRGLTITGLLYLLYDTQSAEDLKTLAELSAKRKRQVLLKAAPKPGGIK